MRCAGAIRTGTAGFAGVSCVTGVSRVTGVSCIAGITLVAGVAIIAGSAADNRGVQKNITGRSAVYDVR